MRFHGGVSNFIGDEASFFYVVGFGETSVWISEDMVIILFDVVRLVVVNEIVFGFHRLFRIEVGWQQFVFDVNQLKRSFGRGFIYGGDASNVVANVAYF